jgi:hypothetical protein
MGQDKSAIHVAALIRAIDNMRQSLSDFPKASPAQLRQAILDESINNGGVTYADRALIRKVFARPGRP